VLTRPLTLGGEGTGADLDNFAVILRTMFGAKVKLVTGYPGGSEVNLAIERGEIDGRCGWSWDSIKSTRPDWLRDRKINLLVVFSLQKAADIPPEVPLILDLAKSDEQRIEELEKLAPFVEQGYDVVAERPESVVSGRSVTRGPERSRPAGVSR